MRVLIFATLFLCAPALAQDNTAPKTAADIPVTIPDELKPLAFLADACWEGPMPDGKQVAAHCVRWFMRGRYLKDRFELKGSNPPYGGETTYYWDHDAKQVRYIYWANDGGYSTGSVKTNDTTLVLDDERYIGKDGELFVRGEIQPVDANTIVWRSELKDPEGKWVPMLNSTMVKKPINWGAN